MKRSEQKRCPMCDKLFFARGFGIHLLSHSFPNKTFCQICGEETKRKHKFCSRKCYYIGAEGIKNSGQFKKGRISQNKKSLITKVCLYCGRGFSNRATKGFLKRKFCSNRCCIKWKLENLPNPGFKKGHRTWNKGSKGFNQNVFRTKEWREKIRISIIAYWEELRNVGQALPKKYGKQWSFELRELIREKYNRECFDCGVLESKLLRRLSVHHIDGNKQNCSENNLAPLCDSCHMKRQRKDFIKAKEERIFENSVVLAD